LEVKKIAVEARETFSSRREAICLPPPGEVRELHIIVEMVRGCFLAGCPVKSPTAKKSAIFC